MKLPRQVHDSAANGPQPLRRGVAQHDAALHGAKASDRFYLRMGHNLHDAVVDGALLIFLRSRSERSESRVSSPIDLVVRRTGVQIFSSFFP